VAIARVELCWSASAVERAAVAAGVHRALVEVLRVPSDDPTVIVTMPGPSDVIAPGKVGDRYSVVTITLFAGRTGETKRRLYRSVVDRLGEVGVPAADVLVVLNDVPVADWGVDGGVPASEVDLGFEIEI